MTDYHDYVFQDGRLVGHFEDMYKESTDVPWHQHEQDSWLDVALTVELLKPLGEFEEIHDYGCGLGYYLDILVRSIGTTQARGFGYDISQTACMSAGRLFPNAAFEVMDLQAPPSENNTHTAPTSAMTKQRLHVIRGTLWYVFPKLTNVIVNIHQRMNPDEILCVIQNFPPLDSEFVGKDVLPRPEALLEAFSQQFRPDKTLWLNDTSAIGNENWYIALFFAR